MKKVIMGIGIPGTGKTTVLKQFAEKNGYGYICPDDIRLELTGNSGDQSKNGEVWKVAYERTADLISKGESVVFDATFVNQFDRTKFINFARENGVEKIQGVYLDVPLEIAKERNAEREKFVPEHVLGRMSKSLEKTPPAVEDGFDSIFTLDEFQKLVEVDKMNDGEVLHKEFKLR